MPEEQQLELRVFKSEPTDPNVHFLIELLRTRATWLTARDLQFATGWPDRTIRQYAEASDGYIISGQKGYKHIDHATPEEVHHTTAWMESQAKKMAERAQTIRRRAHKLVG